MTYAQVSTGYKGGGVNPRPFFTSQALPYDPEKLTAYEVGLKSRLFDRHVSLNTAVFYNRYKDFQGTLLRCDAFSPFPGAPCTMSTNVGDADVRGAELEAQIQPTRALTIDASVGYLDFQYQNVIAATGITRDMTNVYTPDFTAAAGIAYEISLGTAGTLTPRLDYSYRSEIYTDPVNTPLTRIAPQGLLNAKVTWRNAAGIWEASVAATNVTDAFYYESQAMRAAAPYFSGTGRPGAPREYFMTIKRNFD
jgi:iron complex outermembrane receptor protein